MKPRILIVDDHRLVREGLEVMLSKDGVFEVVALAGTGAEALALASKLLPSVVILDLRLPDMRGVEVASKLVSRVPGVTIVVMSMYADSQFVSELMRAGARAYVAKDDAYQHLTEAIQSALAGGVYFSPKVALTIAPQLPAGVPDALPQGRPLTEREIRLLTLMAEGRKAQEIADIIGLRQKTVEMHRQNLKRKLRLTNMAEVTLYAVRHGYLKPRDLPPSS